MINVIAIGGHMNALRSPEALPGGAWPRGRGQLDCVSRELDLRPIMTCVPFDTS